MTETTETKPAAEAAGKPAPATLRALLGEKVGMTQIFTPEGELKGVTVVKAGPCSVVRVKKADGPDGYNAVLLAFKEVREKSLNKPGLGELKDRKSVV